MPALRQGLILAQPSGPPSFLPPPSLLASYRSIKDMLVVRAPAAPKIPGHAGVVIYLSQYGKNNIE
jgi:hypothetical protein